MSRETLTWLNTNTLIGFTSKRGNAWHYKAEEQGEETNHYPLAIPVEDVKRRLFHWQAVEGDVTSTVLTADGVLTVTDPDRKTIVRPDTASILGVFKKGYEIHQYDAWLLGTVASILDDDLSIGSAGLLKGGAIAWVSVEVPDSITTPEGVEFRPNLLATTSLDGSLATTYKRVVTNVVCDNTHGIALGEQGQVYRVKHSRYSQAKLGEAREALAVVHTIADDFAAEVAALCKIDVTTKQWDAFVKEFAPIPEQAGRGQTLAQNKQAALQNLYKNDNRVTPWAGTGWGVVQAVNTYEHHVANVRGSERAERNQLRAVTGGFDTLDIDTVSLLNKVLVTA